ncbi:hypothetical protein [Flavihumibacter petaseus]|uniref:Outer membrane protein n=1 Tax=Flavihumibacter petaseus NBRC 106054 TaxID=1220578 RepID=A0A0E9MW13_9BACT|nr:hypothetical protein [Flavihumibacter petaseus]GAO41693.1 hypothetical protein FPE01S_01_07070 [Flavihumibacter petaseus NBRC 106054]
MHCKIAYLKILGVLILLISHFSTAAQDANYWSSAYGPGSFFMPGGVVAYNGDSGVLFVNPALLAYSRNNAASISGTLYQIQQVTIKNGAGTSLDLKSSHGTIVPLMIAHSIPFKLKLPFSLVYAITTRPVLNYSATQRREMTDNVLNDSYSPGDEVFIGQYSLNNSSSETSFILSGGLALSDHWTVGVTLEGLMHKTDYINNAKLRALQNAGSDTILFPPVSSVEAYYQLNAWSVGGRIKGGISYRPNGHHAFGLMITSPLVNLMGSATLLADEEISDLQWIPGIPLNVLASTRQTNLKSKWKMPVSIAAGYTWDFEKGQLYLASEYFGKVDDYNVVTPRNEAFIRPDTAARNTTQMLRFHDARQAVMNFGIGCSFDLKEKIRGYVSLRTDFSYATDNLFGNRDGYKVNVSDINIYHAQIGANLLKKKFNLRAGLLLSYGKSNDYQQVVNFDDPKDSNVLLGTPGKTSATTFTVAALVSYLYNF